RLDRTLDLVGGVTQHHHHPPHTRPPRRIDHARDERLPVHREQRLGPSAHARAGPRSQHNRGYSHWDPRRRTPTSSAATATAISSGASAPPSTPTGPRTCSIPSGSTPRASSRLRNRPILPRLPITPRYAGLASAAASSSSTLWSTA